MSIYKRKREKILNEISIGKINDKITCDVSTGEHSANHDARIKLCLHSKEHGTVVPILYGRPYVTYRELENSKIYLHENSEKYLPIAIGFAVIYHSLLCQYILAKNHIDSQAVYKQLKIAFEQFSKKYTTKNGNANKSAIIELCEDLNLY